MPAYLATSTLAGPTTLLEALEVARLLGISGVSLSDPLLLSDDERRKVAQSGMEVVYEGILAEQGPVRGLNLAAGDPDVRRRSQDAVAQVLRWAADRGSKLVVVEPGDAILECAFPGVPSEAIAPPKARDQLRRSLDALGEQAHELGVALALQNAAGDRPTQLGARLGEVRDFLAELAIPSLGVLLDWGHLQAFERPGGLSVEENLGGMDRLVALRLRERAPKSGRYVVPSEDGELEAWLAAHADAHALPWILAGEPLGPDRLMPLWERMNARMGVTLFGPVVPKG